MGYTSPLYYANGSIFVKQVYALTGVVPEKKKRQAKKQLKAERIRMSQKNVRNEHQHFKLRTNNPSVTF